MESLVNDLYAAVTNRQALDKVYRLSCELRTTPLDSDYEGFSWRAQPNVPVRVLFEPALNSASHGLVGFSQPRNRFDYVINTKESIFDAKRCLLVVEFACERYEVGVDCS